MEKSKEKGCPLKKNRATLFWQLKATVGDKVGWVRPAQRMSQLQEPYPERNSKGKNGVKKAQNTVIYRILCSYQEQKLFLRCFLTLKPQNRAKTLVITMFLQYPKKQVAICDTFTTQHVRNAVLYFTVFLGPICPASDALCIAGFKQASACQPPARKAYFFGQVYYWLRLCLNHSTKL